MPAKLPDGTSIFPWDQAILVVKKKRPGPMVSLSTLSSAALFTFSMGPVYFLGPVYFHGTSILPWDQHISLGPVYFFGTSILRDDRLRPLLSHTFQLKHGTSTGLIPPWTDGPQILTEHSHGVRTHAANSASQNFNCNIP